MRLAFLFALAGVSGVRAGENAIERTVASGRPAQVAAYHSWDPVDCKSLAAKLTVLTKPSHGTLIPSLVPHVITTSRLGAPGSCYGKPITALQLSYKSAPGYHGPDSFTIDVTFGFENRKDRDAYSITVQ